MKLKSRYARAWWVMAAMATGCGSDSSAPEASAGSGGAGSPSASAGATSMPSQGTGGAGSGTNSEGDPNVSGGIGGGDEASAGNSGMLGNAGGPISSACTASACPAIDVNADGAPEPGCCTMADACGGEIAVMGTTFCAPPAGAIPFDPEPIVPDARCIEQTFDDPQTGGSFTLPGCCDASGICGVSTGGVAGDAGAGIPIACLTPADIAGFGMAGDAGTFAEVSCQ